MATEVIMPALGVAQETGRIVEWMRSEGQEISQGEPLLEIETDKVTVAIEAPASGVLARVRASEGQDVPVGQVIALILAPGEQPPPEVAAAGPLPASPLARRRAKEVGIDLGQVRGTGPGGAVTAGDIDAAIAARGGGSDGKSSEGTIVPGPVWLRMAERVTTSWTSAPHFYLFRDVDASRLTAWRAALVEGVTLTDLLVWLTARALRRHPEANARWDDGRIVQCNDVNVGIAVAVEEGLVVPVVQGADRLGVGEIANARTDLVARARSGAVRPEDVAGGTFTVSNLGMYGVDGFAAIVNAPQAAVLAVGRVTERVMAVKGSAVVRPGMSLALSCDHRVLDGARAARFLATLADLVEEPLGLVT